MPSNNRPMAEAWMSVLAASHETMWVDLLVPTTLAYYRLFLQGGDLFIWDRGSGNWEPVPQPPSGLVPIVSQRI